MTYAVHVEGGLVTREFLERQKWQHLIPCLRLGQGTDAEFSQPLAAVDLAGKIKRENPDTLVTIVVWAPEGR